MNYIKNFTEDFYKETGVYTIKHKQYPDRLYVGSAGSKGGFKERFRRHYQDLIRNVHCNKKLQNVVNKYGIEGIEMEIIECTPANLVIGIEKYWINMLNSYYNIARNAYNTAGVSPTLEKLKQRSKPILQYDLEGNFIKEWWGLREIRRSFPNTSNAIREVCIGKYNSSMGFLWKYKENPDKDIKYALPRKTKKLLVYHLDGTFYKIFDSILQASLELKLNTGNIIRGVKSKSKKCGNYLFYEYKDNFPIKIKSYTHTHKFQKRIKITNLITNEIFIFNSIREAGRFGFNRDTLQKGLKGGKPLVRLKLFIENID